MGLENLLRKYNSLKEECKEVFKEANSKRKIANKVVIEINKYVKRDFANFVKGLNSKLSEKQRITKWKLLCFPEYQDKGLYNGFISDSGKVANLEIDIQICNIGGKQVKTREGKEPYLPIPLFLYEPFSKFANKYKIPINIKLKDGNYFFD